MNGYQLTRQWFEWKFNNPGKMSAGHAELYFYIIDRWNYFNQKSEFGLPRVHTMEVLSIGSHNTFKRLLGDLVTNGFIKIIRESSNQYHHSMIIALSKIDIPFDTPLDIPFDIAPDIALDKAPDTIDKLKNIGTKNISAKKKFVPPTIDEVKAYFIEQGASLDQLERCYYYYADANWTNRDGKKVHDWKRTIKTNWLSKNKNNEQTKEVPGRTRQFHESYNLNKS